jgi:ABC-type transport system involved in multi-copper enzyme maturation permease subunit
LSLFWVQDLVAREIDRKIILQSLSFPVSRAAFLFGRYFAVLALVCLSTCILALSLLLAVALSSPNYDQDFRVGLGVPFWVTIAGLVIDVSVVAAVALATATVSTVSMLPLLVGAGFAIAGKALGAAVDYLARGADGDAPFADAWTDRIETVRWLIPDLSRVDWRDWPLYGVAPSIEVIGWSVLMAVAYSAIVLALGWRALENREFA